jgi:hypothetical protein
MSPHGAEALLFNASLAAVAAARQQISRNVGIRLWLNL